MTSGLSARSSLASLPPIPLNQGLVYPSSREGLTATFTAGLSLSPHPAATCPGLLPGSAGVHCHNIPMTEA